MATERTPGVIEERLGTMIVDGQRCEVWVRSEPDPDGTWHNALLFKRQSRGAPTGTVLTGVAWHLPPGIALQRARELEDKDRIALFHRAMRPRPPFM